MLLKVIPIFFIFLFFTSCDFFRARYQAKDACSSDKEVVSIEYCHKGVDFATEQAYSLLSDKKDLKYLLISEKIKFAMQVKAQAKEACRQDPTIAHDLSLVDDCFSGVGLAINFGLIEIIRHSQTYKSTCGCRDAQKGP